MRLVSMHVDNFGGLHNYDHSFEDGLNVVLHDNGWGKTTMAAFLKAMLYGFDSRRSKDITENERRRYLPWQGGDYGGYLDFEAEGVNYRIFRTFGETPRFDTVRILNRDKKVTAKISPDKIGETLFQLDASAFQRSVFISQNGLSMGSAASSIHTRLNALVSQANDVAAYDDAIVDLTQETKVYEKTGARGRISDITRQIATLERQKGELEQDIEDQDTARTRISEIDILLGSINQDLNETKERLEEVSGEAKEKEASRKLLEKLDGQIADLQQQMDAIGTDLGGKIPSAADMDQVKRQKQLVTSLKVLLKELGEKHTGIQEEYREILAKYDNQLPATAQLDEIQNIYGELQGTRSIGNEDVMDIGAEPEGYAQIQAAVDDDSEYICNLKITIGTQTTIQQFIRKLESQERDIRKEKESWADKKRRYASLKAEVDAVQPEVDASGQYEHEKVTPVIFRLEDLQKQQQLVDVKKEELAGSALTDEQEAMLIRTPEELPDGAEGDSILKKFRDVSRKQSDAEGLGAKLDGEKSKADSLKASIDQMGLMPGDGMAAVEEPKKSVGGAMTGAGTAVAVIGAVLIFVVNPVMAVVAAVGAVLAVLGVVHQKQYKTKQQEYEAYKANESQRKEAQKRKDDLQSQLDEVEDIIASYKKQIADMKRAMEADQAQVNHWYAKWGTVGTDISETAIRDVLDQAEQVRKLRKKRQETSEKQRFVDETTEHIRSGLTEVEGDYPEIAGKSFGESLALLRSAETNYKIKADKLATAQKNLDKFLKEAEVSEEVLANEESPGMETLKNERDETEKELEQALAGANEVFVSIGLTVSKEDMSVKFREAEQTLNHYTQYADKLKGREERQQKKQKCVENLQQKLEAGKAALKDCYGELEMPERLRKIREDVASADKLKERIKESEREQTRQKAKLDKAAGAVDRFVVAYGRFEPETEDILAEIYGKAGVFAKLDAARKGLEKQKEGINPAQSEDARPVGAQETELRSQVAALEKRKEELLVEYTQKSDLIRQADQSLEKYPDVVQEIHQLYDQKQKAQNRLVMLKRTIHLITRARENLANRYLSRVEDTFNNYMHLWLEHDAVRGILDIDFNVTIEENEKVHVAEGYSTGYCDLMDFCMRLALVDTLFESEQPFLILDDPFINLDEDRLDKALELLNVMAADRQIIYFVCHPVRAVEASEHSASRAAFVRLAEETRKTLKERKVSGGGTRKAVRKSPKEMYKVVNPGAPMPFKPTRPNYTITNNIFSMNFVMDESGLPKDNSYELFFIDGMGHVLNERQILEINGGRLSVERVQFCLNTRDDSGDEYELMIRESGQDDYDVVARIPFKAKLAFAGTDSFGF